MTADNGKPSVAKLQQLYSEMSPGPLHVVDKPHGNGTLVDDLLHRTIADCDQLVGGYPGAPQCRANAAGIAALVNAAPVLLEIVTAALRANYTACNCGGESGCEETCAALRACKAFDTALSTKVRP